MKKITCLLPLSLLLMLAMSFGSCNGGTSSANDSLAIIDTLAPSYYRYLKNEQFDSYVNAMASVEGKPQTYRDMILLAVKQHEADVKKYKGGIKDVCYARKEVYNQGKMVKAFLNVTYADSTTEVIILPLIKKEEKWMLQ